MVGEYEDYDSDVKIDEINKVYDGDDSDYYSDFQDEDTNSANVAKFSADCEW